MWHWYDFACPYSYVAQDHTAILRRVGLCPDLWPYSVRTETGRSAVLGQVRDSPTHQLLERAAQAAGFTDDRVAGARHIRADRASAVLCDRHREEPPPSVTGIDSPGVESIGRLAAAVMIMPGGNILRR